MKRENKREAAATALSHLYRTHQSIFVLLVNQKLGWTAKTPEQCLQPWAFFPSNTNNLPVFHIARSHIHYSIIQNTSA